MSSASSSLLPFLNHDVMAHIFKLNTQRHLDVCEILEVSELHTTRLTSQVCRSWRQLILQSPVIWGSVIDLDALSKASEQWFEEVMKRTGKARLSIYGRVYGSPTIKKLVSLLEENWDRVHRLEVDIFEGQEIVDLDRFYDIFWKRRAPILQNFSVYVCDRPRFNTRKWKDLTLFSGSAPLLRCISTQGFHFDQHALWLSQLVSVDLSDPFTICDALPVLVNTPLLETLIIKSTVRYDDSAKSWHQKIHLPNLESLDITSNIAGMLIYLSYIAPGSNCVLGLDIDDTSTHFQNNENDDLQRLLKIISAYVEGFHSVHCPQRLAIQVNNHRVAFCIYEKWDEAVKYCNPSFRIYIHIDLESDYSDSIVQTDDPSVVDILLSTLAPTTLGNVHTFNFHVMDSWLPTTDVIIHILRSLTAVKKMTITPEAMHGLNRLSESATLFPNLADVTIQCHAKLKNLGRMLGLFLTRRREAGKPLRKAYKPEKSRSQRAKHWVFLEQFEGLRVMSSGHGEDGNSDDSDDRVDDTDGSNGSYDAWNYSEYYDHDEDYQEYE